jgi:predicted nucleic acid-binding protein
MSETVEHALLAISDPHISYLTDLEFNSAISKKVRNRELRQSDGHKIINQFQSHVGDQLYQWLPLDLKHFQLARSWIAQFSTSLRTLDGLHLAVAALSGIPIMSLDAQLVAAAEYYGIRVIPL